MGYYVVRESDHLIGVAHAHGVDAAVIWDHPANDALRGERGDGSILRAGDLLFVPDPPPRTPHTIEGGSTATFRATVAKVPVRLRLEHAGSPIAGEPYRLVTPGETLTGESDGNGIVDARVRAFVGRAELYLDRRRERYSIVIGGLDPASDVRGLQMRLRNLALYAGAIHGRLDAATVAAIVGFQRSRSLAETGEADEATMRELRGSHGS